MARYAAAVLGVPEAKIQVEPRARSTWENIAFSLPLAEEAERIAIASDPFHALRARRYVEEQRPDLAAKLTPAEDYRFLEWWWWKPLCTLNHAWWVFVHRGPREVAP